LVSAATHRRPRPGGFTLLELLVVLLIAGLLVALTPPLISAAVPGMRAQTAARSLAATLRDARFAAISRGAEVDVRFDLEGRRYAVAGARAESLPRGIGIRLQGPGARDGDDRAAPGGYTLRFYADGSSNGLRARVGPERGGYIVAVDWLMGRVSLTEVPNRGE
jgi:general secretion pathway protein H